MPRPSRDGCRITKEASQHLLRNTMTALALAGVLTAAACSGGNDDTAAAKDEAPEADRTAAAEASSGGSEGGSGESFCDSAKKLYDQLTASAPTGPTSPEVQAVFAEAKALEAPEEIAADWTTVLETLVEPVVNGELDPTDPEATATLTERAASIGESLQRTGAYFETECGFE